MKAPHNSSVTVAIGAIRCLRSARSARANASNISARAPSASKKQSRKLHRTHVCCVGMPTRPAHKGAHEAILQRFAAHDADVMVGTQMIAKGLDLPLVTLVGVIAADTGLFLPDFRSGERTFQLLTQVAGRAGRSARGGRVVIQSYQPEHHAIQAAAQHDYEAFYRREIAFRRQHAYPPLQRLARWCSGTRMPKRPNRRVCAWPPSCASMWPTSG